MIQVTDMAPVWPLVARESELEAFARAWGSDRVQAVTVWGPAGVGKTRLAEEFVDRAAAAGFRVDRATATSAASMVPLGAIAHLIPAGVDLADPVAGFAQVARMLADQHRRLWVLLVSCGRSCPGFDAANC